MAQSGYESNGSSVRTRFLEPSERPVEVGDPRLPKVIVPGDSSSFGCIDTFLRRNGPQIIKDIGNHGAVLLRGFDLRSVSEFERLITGIPGMHGIREVLMSEDGREIVNGTNFVLHTSTAVKTGGTLDFGPFHTENFYVPDVPRFICFFCLKPSRWGGETGLVNVARLYEDLPLELKRTLEQQAYWTATYPLTALARRYECSVEAIEQFCQQANLMVGVSGGEKALLVYKPCVMVHPLTGERGLTINFNGELDGKGLRQELTAAFSTEYTGVRWLMHRLYWNQPVLSWIKRLAQRIVVPFRIGVPIRVMLRFVFSRLRFWRKRAKLPQFNDTRVGDLFSVDDVKVLAQLMRKHYSAFQWKQGDVLIIDNLKVAHAGMPGFGRRELKVVICNCVAVPCSPEPGTFTPANDGNIETVGARLRESVRRSV